MDPSTSPDSDTTQAAEPTEPAAAERTVEPSADHADSPSPHRSILRALRSPRLRLGRPRPRDLVAGVLVLLLIATTTLSVVFGWKLKNRNDVDDAAGQALDAARHYAVTLTSIDADHIDADLAAVRAGATGDFKDMYTDSANRLKPLLVQAKSVSKGQVVAASVQSASKNHVVVMLFVDAAITNVTSPEPRIDRNRIIMTMDKVDGRWLADKVDLP